MNDRTSLASPIIWLVLSLILLLKSINDFKSKQFTNELIVNHELDYPIQSVTPEMISGIIVSISIIFWIIVIIRTIHLRKNKLNIKE